MKKYQDTQKQLLRLVKKTYIIYTIFLKKPHINVLIIE
jgi:hypothetical protein